MKHTLLLATACVLLAIFAFMPAKRNLVGHWTMKFSGGQMATVEFKDDGTFETEIPAEQFTIGGQDNLNDDVLSISDTS